MSRLLILQHIEREGPGLFSKIAKNRGMETSIYRLDLGEELPKLITGDILLVLGGPMSINDIKDPNFPWLIKELSFIKEALNNNFRIIGVCLGAQLLANAAGGKVEVLSNEATFKPLPEVGWGPIVLNKKNNNDSLGDLLSLPFPVLHWHGDRILLPPCAELIASSNRCEEQLFKIGSQAYGLQFHIETEGEMVKKWIEEDKVFIKTALGIDAESILLRQEKIHREATHRMRSELIIKLFEELNNCPNF